MARGWAAEEESNVRLTSEKGVQAEPRENTFHVICWELKLSLHLNVVPEKRAIRILLCRQRCALCILKARVATKRLFCRHSSTLHHVDICHTAKMQHKTACVDTQASTRLRQRTRQRPPREHVVLQVTRAPSSRGRARAPEPRCRHRHGESSSSTSQVREPRHRYVKHVTGT